MKKNRLKLVVDNTKEPALMEDGVWYDLTPPANIKGKKFHRVICEYRVPNKPNWYSVRGVPEGGKKEEPFILQFSAKGRVMPKKSEDQR